MYPVSLEYQNKIKENNRIVKINIRIEHSTGVLFLSDKDLALGSLIYKEESQAGEEFTIGGIGASDISFTIMNKPEYDNINFMGATVYPIVSLLIKEGADTHFLQPTQPSKFLQSDDLWEEVPLGKFNIDYAKILRNTIELKAVDDMLNLDKPYSLSQLSYPANLYQIYVNICNFGDIQIGTFDFPNKNYVVNERPDGELTFRDVLGYVAELSGTFAKFNRTGALELKWYKPTGLTLHPSNRFSFKPSDDVVQIKGIMVTVDDTTYLTGSEDYAINLTDNPLLQGDYETVLPNIFNNVKDTIFTPYTSDWQGNMAIEAGDMITQIDIDGKVYNTLVTKSMYKYRGRSVLEAKGLPEISKGYKGSTNKRIAQIKRIVEKEVGDKLTTLEQAQLNATELMTNMLGGHIIEDKENGILYIADNPDLELATKIWKWGTGGFGYSEDGGVTWGTAITADGSIVAKLISAGLITADMIQAGLLQSQDGSTWINLDDGTFNLKNKIKFVNGEFSIELSEEELGIDISELKNHNIIFSNENQTFPTTSSGAVANEIVISSLIDTFKGTSRINSTIDNVTLKNKDGQTITGGTLVKVNPTSAQSGSVTWNIPNGTNITSDSGWIEMSITIETITYTKKLTWNKAKSGTDGTDGKDGEDGTDGVDGVIGRDAYTLILTNEAQSFPANSSGNILQAVTTSTDIIAYIGTTSVTPIIGTLPVVIGLTLSKSGSKVTIQANQGSQLAQSGSFIIPITVDGKQFSKTFTWTKVNAGIDGSGANAKLVNLTGNQVFKYAKGTTIPLPTYIVFTATPQNTEGSIFKWEYSINGGVTFTTISGATNSTYTLNYNTAYWNSYESVVLRVTIDGVNDTTTVYRVRDGSDGYTPVKGTDYFDGVKGQDGQSSYIWIKYSAYADGTNFSDTPNKYIGVATTTTPTTPSVKTAYRWTKIEGTDGTNGVKGETGTNGQTSYLHIKYSDNGTSFTANNGEIVGAWIGTYVDFIEADSMTFSKYTWNKVKGSDGTNAKLVDIVPSNVYFTKKRIGENYIVIPDTITLTPNFQNCVYSKWEYSINGTDWTAITRTTVSTTLPYMNSSSRVLTIPKAWSIIVNNDYVVFKITSTTGESDIQTISVLYDVGELETRVSSAEQKITPTAITNTVKDAITSGAIDVVTTSEVEQTMDSWVAKFDYLKTQPPIRYVRSWMNGRAGYLGGGAWIELEVFVNGINVARNRPVTSNHVAMNLSRYVDGIKGTSFSHVTSIEHTDWAYLQVDLGQVYTNVEKLIDYHYAPVGGLRYNAKLQVSSDGTNWITLFDSDIQGTYEETTEGKVYNFISGFQQGITTIDGQGVKVEHTDFQGQYSEMRADGFVRKWPNGEVGYLNGVDVIDYGVPFSDRSSPPLDYTVPLPAYYKDRTDFEVIPFGGESSYQVVGGNDEYMFDRVDIILHTLIPVTDVESPYVKVKSYYRIYTVGRYEDFPPRYYPMSFKLLIIGK